MRCVTTMFLGLTVLGLAALLIGPSEVLAYPATGYYAALNTLPESQGWEFQDGGGPLPTVSGGTLYQGPTPHSSGQLWRTYGAPTYDFMSTEKFIAETEMKVISSTYDPSIGGSGKWRTGYNLVAYDKDGRWFALGIASEGIRLTYNSEDPSPGASTGFVAFDTTTAFNKYRVEVASGWMEVFINGVSQATLAVGPVIGGPSEASQVWFGDGTGWGWSETELHYVTFGGTTPVPLPPALLLLAPGLIGVAAMRRRLH